jgi:hypothetical protein
MGFLDKMKKKAQNAVGNVAGPPPTPQAAAPQAPAAYAAPPQAAPQSGPTFTFNGDTRPLPSGWDGLSMEEWFYKYEMLRDEMMNIDEKVGLPHMTDEDGDDLDPEEVLLITEFGFRSGGDYEAYTNWCISSFAQQTGENFTDCAFRMGGIARERIMAEKAGAMSGAGGALEPIEGVTCEQWAQLMAQVVNGADTSALVASVGGQAKWDRVNAEWNARMASDTTMAIATVYGNAFAGGAQGQFGGAAAQAADQGVGGDLGAEPVPFETYVEIMEAQNAAAAKGEDAAAVLSSFGMSPLDWSNVGMYWSKKQQQEATKYHQLFIEYSAKYQGKYGTGDGLTSDQREEKVLAHIIQLASTGQAAQIVPYLKDYFPEEAEDMDAQHWWVDKACDMCGESGNRATAEQLLYVRYHLQEDHDDPQDVWVASELESLF